MKGEQRTQLPEGCDFEARVDIEVAKAVMTEREACAMLAENSMAKGGHLVAEWIRMRSNANVTGLALHAATRRAIVRAAAAEIGKEMK